MWWWLVTYYPHTSFDNCHSQGVSIEMSGHRLTNGSTMCNPKLYASKICSNFHIHKNNSLLWLLLNTCNFFDFVDYKCLNANLPFPITPNVKATCVELHDFRGLYILSLGVSEMGQSALFGIHMHVNLTGGSDTWSNGGPPSVISSLISYPWQKHHYPIQNWCGTLSPILAMHYKFT